MSKCVFCGEEVGFLRKSHSECQKAHDVGVDRIRSMTLTAALGAMDLDAFKVQSTEVANQSFISEKDIRMFMIQGWETAVESALEDGILSIEEENSLDAYKQRFSFSQDDLDEHGAYMRLVKACVIRDLIEGKLPERVNINGVIPFNLQKDEALRWLFNNVPCYEERSRTTYTGGYQGASVRIAKGVYYRVGGFSSVGLFL